MIPIAINSGTSTTNEHMVCIDIAWLAISFLINLESYVNRNCLCCLKWCLSPAGMDQLVEHRSVHQKFTGAVTMEVLCRTQSLFN